MATSQLRSLLAAQTGLPIRSSLSAWHNALALNRNKGEQMIRVALTVEAVPKTLTFHAIMKARLPRKLTSRKRVDDEYDIQPGR
jgi:hypothetical protein